jgi:hypothetical protein
MVQISGGTFQGGNATEIFDYAGAGAVLYTSYPSGTSIQISGGTFQGGNGGLLGGNGASLGAGANEAGFMTVSGGTFQGGNGQYAGFGASFATEYGGSITVSGGTFQGGSGLNPGAGAFFNSVGSGSITVSGGTFQGGNGDVSAQVALFSGSSMTISGGTFIGGLQIVSGGSSIFPPFSQLNVTGGIFSGPIELEPYNTNLNFFGMGFVYNYQTGSFTGTLTDGDMIDVVVPNYTGSIQYIVDGPNEVTFNYGIPEPSSIVTLAIGLLGLAAAQAYRSRQRHVPVKNPG